MHLWKRFGPGVTWEIVARNPIILIRTTPGENMEESHDDDGGLSAGCLMLDLLINNLMCMESAYGRRTRGTASTLAHTCVGEECLNFNHQPTNFSSFSNHCAKSHAPLEAFHLSILAYIQRPSRHNSNHCPIQSDFDRKKTWLLGYCILVFFF